MKRLSRVILFLFSLCLLSNIAGLTGQSSGKDTPDPLAPLTPPQKDFWVGTVTIQKKKDTMHHRNGPGMIAHAMMKGDGLFTGSAEHHSLYRAIIKSEPCPDTSVCLSRNAGEVHYRVTNHHFSKTTQPIVCRGGKAAMITDTDDFKHAEAADGSVIATFSVYMSSNDHTWHIKAAVSGKNLVCESVTEKHETYDQQCGNQPVIVNPKPKKEPCDVDSAAEDFSTGITDPDILRLDGTEPIELMSSKPDNGTDGNINKTGTISVDHSVTYQLRRILEY